VHERGGERRAVSIRRMRARKPLAIRRDVRGSIAHSLRSRDPAFER
jgi:hypothetical protein